MIIKADDAPPISKNQRSLNQANQCFYDENYDEALEIYRELKEQVGGINMHANIGYCLQKLDQHLEAVEHFETFIEEFPYRHHIWKAMAYSYYNLNNYEMMSRCARESIKWDIDRNTIDDYSWQQMATAHFLLGDLSTALKAARKTIAINKHNAFAHYYRVCIYYKVWQGETLEAAELLTEEITREFLVACLAEAIALSPVLLRDVREEKIVSHLLDDPIFDQVDAWCYLADIVRLGDIHQLYKIWKDKIPRSEDPVQETDADAEAKTDIDLSLKIQQALHELDLNSSLGTWSLWDIAARYEQLEIMQLRHIMKEDTQDQEDHSELNL